MQKSLSLLFILLLLTPFLLLAQEPILLLIHEQSGGKVAYKTGDKIGYVVKSDSAEFLQWDKITHLKADSMWMEQGQSVAYKDVVRVERYKGLQYFIAAITLPLNKIGVVWFSAGAIFFSNGVFNFSEAFDPLGTADSFLLGGVIDMTIGLTLMVSPLLLKFIKNKIYKMSDGWELKVVTGTP